MTKWREDGHIEWKKLEHLEVKLSGVGQHTALIGDLAFLIRVSVILALTMRHELPINIASVYQVPTLHKYTKIIKKLSFKESQKWLSHSLSRK